MSDDDLGKLPPGAIDWLQHLSNPTLPPDPNLDLDRMYRGMLPFPEPDDLAGPYNAFTGQPFSDPDADYWCGWCLENKLIRAVPWPHDVLFELTPLGRRALELAGAKSPGPDGDGEQTDPKAEQPTIWYHGEMSYSTDKHNPKTVSREAHSLLQAFLDRDSALDTKALTMHKTRAVCNPSDVIGKIEKKFGKDAIRRPQQRGDGYFIRVRSLNATN